MTPPPSAKHSAPGAVFICTIELNCPFEPVGGINRHSEFLSVVKGHKKNVPVCSDVRDKVVRKGNFYLFGETFFVDNIIVCGIFNAKFCHSIYVLLKYYFHSAGALPCVVIL